MFYTIVKLKRLSICTHIRGPQEQRPADQSEAQGVRRAFVTNQDWLMQTTWSS